MTVVVTARDVNANEKRSFQCPSHRDVIVTEEVNNTYTRGVAVHRFGDDANVDHIARHGFSPKRSSKFSTLHTRFAAVAPTGIPPSDKTLDGRFAFVVYERRPGGRIRVVTARDMESKERRVYRRK